MKWRKQFDAHEDLDLSYSTAVDTGDEEITVQSYKDDCDINLIVSRFGVTGHLPVARSVPEYGNFASMLDYHDALNRLVEAREAFETLPAKVRERFRNDPGELVGFLQDEANADEAVRLGLIPKPAVEAVPGPVSAPPAPASAGDPSTTST